VNSKRFINQCHEYIFHLTKNGDVRLDRLAVGVPYKHKSNVSRWKSNDRDLRCRGNTWFIPYDTINSRRKDRPHPASFPPALAAMAMRLHGTDRISRAMDPFLGIGSSALAAQKLGIDFIGFEIDKQYLQTARSRLKNRQPELF
jgi:site-specific DNA-methyltransferase (adenine-specific)